MEENIKDIIKKLFEKLSINYEKLDIIMDNQNIFFIKIKTNDSPLLIWSHWKNLEAIEFILKSIIINNLDNKIKLHLEINDYIHSKDERLKKYVLSKVEFAKKIWKDIRLNKLNAYERKKAHSYVSELNDKDVSTKSKWEAEERRLYICINNKTNNYEKKPIVTKLTIDIDSFDI